MTPVISLKYVWITYKHERDLAGQDSICRPVSLKSNLLQLAHLPADRLLACQVPFML